MDEKRIWFYGRSGKDYAIKIPSALNLDLMGKKAGTSQSLCLMHGPEKINDHYLFSCSMPSGHTGKYHLSCGTNEVIAIWPVEQSNDRH
jgi:hypothetical protein